MNNFEMSEHLPSVRGRGEQDLAPGNHHCNNRNAARKFPLRSEMVTCSSYSVPPKKLGSSTFVSSSDQNLMSGDTLVEQQRTIEGKLTGKETNSPEVDTPSTCSTDCCDRSSKFSKVVSSSHQSGPDPTSEVHFPQTFVQDQSLLPVITPAEYPAEFKLEHFDCVIIYSDNESDKKLALNFKDIIEKHLVLKDGRPPAICVLDRGDNISTVQSRFKHSDIAMTNSTYIFLLMTENFINDSWAEMQKDECLMMSINNPDRKRCLVPLHTKHRGVIKYPYGLLALKGLDISRMLPKKNLEDVDPKTVEQSDLDKAFVANLTKMFNQRLKQKLDREKEQEKKLKDWIDKEQEQRKLELAKEQQWKKEQIKKYVEELEACQQRSSSDHLSEGD